MSMTCLILIIAALLIACIVLGTIDEINKAESIGEYAKRAEKDFGVDLQLFLKYYEMARSLKGESATGKDAYDVAAEEYNKLHNKQ